MRYKLYAKTEQAWDAMLDNINQAKSSIFIEMLRQKSVSGVRVKIIYDSFGSGGGLLDKSIIKLKDAGVELFFFKKLFRYTHRKVLIVDEKVAFRSEERRV